MTFNKVSDGCYQSVDRRFQILKVLYTTYPEWKLMVLDPETNNYHEHSRSNTLRDCKATATSI